MTFKAKIGSVFLDTAGLKNYTKVLLVYLVHASETGGLEIDQKDMQRDTGICETSVRKGVYELEDAGILSVDRSHRRYTYKLRGKYEMR